ncbi:MAG: MBOAT family protein [Sphingomonadaceae bacterium]|nr:MBOAT family protein [Sphingomonadaceae bacterium]
MLFNSVTYILVFLPLAVLLYWALSGRARLAFLISASIIFYGFWRVEFLPLMFASAVVDYFLAIAIDKAEDQKRRKHLMWVSIAFNLGVLGFFKYLVFFKDTIWSIAGAIGYAPSPVELYIILPLGISFYIFQTMSYTIDVYRRDIRPERDMLTYLAFVTFFPHLVAGPIMRPHILIPQLENPPPFRWRNMRIGFERILAGLFMKVVLADSVAPFVDAGFAQGAHSLTAIDSWTLTFLFGFQIYFDFAGYSSIAIGSALMMSIFVPENFNWPYMATSPREFWKRWHISLSTWIRDYLYIPIMGNYKAQGTGAWDTFRDVGEVKSAWRRTYALFLTWAIMGLWHGANWTFAVWGIYHAVLIYLHRLLAPLATWRGRAMPAWLAWLCALPLMMAGWIPFRATTLADSFTMWGRMFWPFGHLSMSLTPNSYILAAALMLGSLIIWYAREVVTPKLGQTALPVLVMRTLYFMVAGAIVFIMLQSRSQFIYFQF